MPGWNMPDDLRLHMRRWQEAEASAAADAPDAADRAFTALYDASMSPPLPAQDFVARTMAAVAEVSAAEVRRARILRRALLWLGVPAALVIVYLGAGTAISLVSRAFVSGLNLLVSTVVVAADGANGQRVIWSVLTGLGRAAAAFVSDTRVTVAMIVCQVSAIAALVALRRALGSGREWLE